MFRKGGESDIGFEVHGSGGRKDERLAWEKEQSRAANHYMIASVGSDGEIVLDHFGHRQVMAIIHYPRAGLVQIHTCMISRQGEETMVELVQVGMRHNLALGSFMLTVEAISGGEAIFGF